MPSNDLEKLDAAYEAGGAQFIVVLAAYPELSAEIISLRKHAESLARELVEMEERLYSLAPGTQSIETPALDAYRKEYPKE